MDDLLQAIPGPFGAATGFARPLNAAVDAEGFMVAFRPATGAVASGPTGLMGNLPVASDAAPDFQSPDLAARALGANLVAGTGSRRFTVLQADTPAPIDASPIASAKDEPSSPSWADVASEEQMSGDSAGVAQPVASPLFAGTVDMPTRTSIPEAPADADTQRAPKTINLPQMAADPGANKTSGPAQSEGANPVQPTALKNPAPPSFAAKAAPVAGAPSPFPERPPGSLERLGGGSVPVIASPISANSPPGAIGAPAILAQADPTLPMVVLNGVGTVPKAQLERSDPVVQDMPARQFARTATLGPAVPDAMPKPSPKTAGASAAVVAVPHVPPDPPFPAPSFPSSPPAQAVQMPTVAPMPAVSAVSDGRFPDAGLVVLTAEAFDFGGAPDGAPPAPAVASGIADRQTAVVTVQSIARQILHGAVDQKPDSHGSTDIALDPPELGRVRMSLAEVNGTLSLTITAERPETAEMMRRHIALLTEEFARAGLDAPHVDISHGGGNGRQAPHTAPARMLETSADILRLDPIQSSQPAIAGGGLDLRL